MKRKPALPSKTAFPSIKVFSQTEEDAAKFLSARRDCAHFRRWQPIFLHFFRFFVILRLTQGERKCICYSNRMAKKRLPCGFVCCKISLFLRFFNYCFAMKNQKYLNARKPNLSKFGHRASGIGHRASGIGHRASAISLLC